MINAIIVEPNKYAQKIQISGDSMYLKLLIDTVAYEQIYPFKNKEICVIISEHRNVEGLPFNRAIFKNDGETIKEVLAGKFVVVATTEHELRSLTQEEENEVMNLLYLPQKFFYDDGDLIAFEYRPKEKSEVSEDSIVGKIFEGKYKPQEIEQDEEHAKRTKRYNVALQEFLTVLPNSIYDAFNEVLEASSTLFSYEKRVSYKRGIAFAKEMFFWATQ